MSKLDDLIKDFGQDLFSKQSEIAQKRSVQPFTYPEAGLDKTFNIVEPFEKIISEKLDAKGIILYKMTVFDYEENGNRTIVAGENVIKPLCADIINNDILLDSGLENMKGLAWDVETIQLKDFAKDEAGNVVKDKNGNPVYKRFHKFTFNPGRSSLAGKKLKHGIDIFADENTAKIEETAGGDGGVSSGVPTTANVPTNTGS
jgi:hypothetical protein